MLDRVNKRAKRVKEMREKSRKDVSHTRIIYDFLVNLENMYKIAKDPFEYKVMLDDLCKVLESRMRGLDPKVYLEIVWNTSDDDSWTQLRATGVTIKWSSGYIERTPGVIQDEYIDVMQFLLENPD